MQISDVVLGLASGVGIDLSQDGKTAYIVEWSIGELSKVDINTGMVTTVKTGLSYPEDVEVDWPSGEIFVSERTGAVMHIWSGEKSEVLAKPGGAPQQLDLKKDGRRFLYTVGYDSGLLVRIDVDKKTTTTLAAGLGHPVGLVVDAAQKYAYVTEQDKGALTCVELKSGQATQLCFGLVSPFFLAWDKDAKGIFCVQRDPANNLVWLDPGSSPVGVKPIAGGLAWRPSGVALNADNSLIYICADRELEVVSFNGSPPLKHPKPPFDIYSIQFYDEKSGALQLKDHLASTTVPLPEYVKNTRSGPAIYIGGTLPHIKVVLKKRPGFVNGAYAIGATGSLGGVRRKTVNPVFNASGLTKPIDFELMWPLPAAVGKPDVTFDWYARRNPGPSIPVSVGATSHRLYLVLAKPTAPWVAELPWIAALEIACGWAAGAATVDDAATRITERYYNCGRVKYDDVNGGTWYGNGTYALAKMIERLNGGTGLGQKVNCTDSANTVSTFANLVGCDLWQSKMASNPDLNLSKFKLNPILAIGYPPPSPWPTWGGFRYHEVAWKGACTESDRLFDGCLMVDGDADPTSAPHAWTLPTNLLFGDCATMNYRLRLSPPVAGGCADCKPQPATFRQRRPIV